MSPLPISPESSPPSAERSATLAVTLFPLVIVGGGVFGFFAQGVAAGMVPLINPLLGVIMFCMGLTLTTRDFRLVLTRPLPVLVGVVAQYAIMPGVGWVVAHLLPLSPELAAGVIIVGCAPGGTASNVVSYLANADTALSVTMTSVSTLLAPVLMPLLTLWLAGTYMPLDGTGMAMSILQIVLVPVAAGLIVRLGAPRLVDRLLPVLPWFSTLSIAMVVSAITARSADQVITAGLLVLGAVVLQNGLGLLLGYGFAKALRQPVRTRRTVAIEVGMQNSGLAAGLAATYVSPVAALPGAVFSIWHNVTGALLAAVWRQADARRHRAAGGGRSDQHGQ